MLLCKKKKTIKKKTKQGWIHNQPDKPVEDLFVRDLLLKNYRIDWNTSVIKKGELTKTRASGIKTNRESLESEETDK